MRKPFEKDVFAMAHEMPFRDVQVTASEIGVREIGLNELWQALKLGFDDFKAKPSHLPFLVLFYFLFALLLTLFLVGDNLLHLAFPNLDQGGVLQFFRDDRLGRHRGGGVGGRGDAVFGRPRLRAADPGPCDLASVSKTG